MKESVVIHPRIQERHPKLTDNDVLHAWHSCVRSVPRLDRDGDEYIAVGMDAHGRLLEMIARRTTSGLFVIFHAFTPPTRKALVELGMTRRR